MKNFLFALIAALVTITSGCKEADTTPPYTVISNHRPLIDVDEEQKVDVASYDASGLSECLLSVDGQDYLTMPKKFRDHFLLSWLPQPRKVGQHQLTATCSDMAGNWSKPETVSYEVVQNKKRVNKEIGFCLRTNSAAWDSYRFPHCQCPSNTYNNYFENSLDSCTTKFAKVVND